MDHLRLLITIDESVEDCLEQIGLTVQHAKAALREAAAFGDCLQGELGLRLCDDAAIHEVNVEFLQHDYPTDVISFPYQCDPPQVEGELIVSVSTAMAVCGEHGLTAAQETLLYIVHGALHLVGLDDTNNETRAEMRAAEKAVMRTIGIDLDAMMLGESAP